MSRRWLEGLVDAWVEGVRFQASHHGEVTPCWFFRELQGRWLCHGADSMQVLKRLSNRGCLV